MVEAFNAIIFLILIVIIIVLIIKLLEDEQEKYGNRIYEPKEKHKEKDKEKIKEPEKQPEPEPEKVESETVTPFSLVDELLSGKREFGDEVDKGEDNEV